MAKNHYTIGLAIAGLVGLVLTLLFQYLWIQLAYNLYWEISTINIFYAIIGIILFICGIFLSFILHHTIGELLVILGVGFIAIVLFYYLLSL